MKFNCDQESLAIKLYAASILIFSRPESNSLLTQKKQIRYIKSMILSQNLIFPLTETSGIIRTNPL